jgi:hypothetical protein
LVTVGSRPFRRMVATSALALGLGVGCSGIGSTRYVGTVTNRGLPNSPASLSLTLLRGTDTSFTAYLLIGAPLGGSGSAYGWFGGDTIKLVTISESGDTIFWLSPQGGATLDGRYSITGGQNAGRGGTWTARLVRGPALTGGTHPRTPAPGSVPLLIVGTVVLAAGLVAAAAWVRAAPRRVAATPSPAEGAGKEWHGVGGWMAWFLLGQGLTAVISAVRLISDWPPWTPASWAFGNALSGFNLLIMMETVANIGLIVVPLIGLVLTAKKHPAVPRLWFAYLIGMFVYALTDVVGTAIGMQEAQNLFGDGAVTRAMQDAVSPAAALNIRLMFWALIWALYWARSKRVRNTFGHGAVDRVSQA